MCPVCIFVNNFLLKTAIFTGRHYLYRGAVKKYKRRINPQKNERKVLWVVLKGQIRREFLQNLTFVASISTSVRFAGKMPFFFHHN
ncbi:MAG: hypothetical protein D6730_16815 [Bacteroidetes bacterium]|nr:MAG: hypothetical protein D6730_16815 [Bacteroidota bacterium]